MQRAEAFRNTLPPSARSCVQAGDRVKLSFPSLLSPSWCGQGEQVTDTCVPAPWPPPQWPPQWCEERVGGRGEEGGEALICCSCRLWCLPAERGAGCCRPSPPGCPKSGSCLQEPSSPTSHWHPPEGALWKGALLLLSVITIYCLSSAEQSLGHKKAQ